MHSLSVFTQDRVCYTIVSVYMCVALHCDLSGRKEEHTQDCVCLYAMLCVYVRACIFSYSSNETDVALFLLWSGY